MQFVRPYLFPFSIRNAGTNLLLLSVVIFIPIVGLMVLLGYRAEIADELADNPDDTRCRDFSFDRFGELLSRGISPFLYMLIQIGAFFVAYMISYVGMIAIMFSQSGKPDPVLMIVTILSWVFAISFFQLVTMMLIWPFLIYASLARKFAFGEAFPFAKDFYSRVGWLMIGILFPKLIFDSIAYLIGAILCYIGLFPAAVIVMLAEQHFMMQLYRKYIERGGKRIARPMDEFEDFDEAEPEPEREPR